MLRTVFLIGAFGTMMLGQPTSATSDKPTHAQRPDSLPSLLRSSSCVQGFVLQGPGLISDKDGPNLHGFRIIGLGPIANSPQVEKLCQLVQEASVVRCGEPKLRPFDPGFGLRFILSGETLDVLIARTCDSWLFMQGGRSISGVTFETDCISHSLSELMQSIFESGARK